MATTQWALDAAHSEVQFKVKHMMVSTVTGHFKQFNATVQMEGNDLTTARVNFETEVASISTNNEQRDGHLRSGDFFDTENHPKITFTGSRWEKKNDEEYTLHGDLTMRGVTQPIALNVEFGGVMTDPWGMQRSGFVVKGVVSRKDFGVSFSMVSETGGVLLGNDIKIECNVEFTQVQAA